MVLDWCQNLISAQYLDNAWWMLTVFRLCIYIGKIYFGIMQQINFCKFMTELLPLIDVRTSFPLNILTTNWWILIKFCILILTRSRLGLLHINFWKLITLWPLIDVIILFPLNIFNIVISFVLCQFCQAKFINIKVSQKLHSQMHIQQNSIFCLL